MERHCEEKCTSRSEYEPSRPRRYSAVRRRQSSRDSPSKTPENRTHDPEAGKPTPDVYDDTMFVCLTCNTRFNSHAPLAEHILSERHRRRIREELFLATHPDDLPNTFYCILCEEMLSPRGLLEHVRQEPHLSASHDRVQRWYSRQPFGLSRDRQRTAERHLRGIDRLVDALNDVYCLDLD